MRRTLYPKTLRDVLGGGKDTTTSIAAGGQLGFVPQEETTIPISELGLHNTLPDLQGGATDEYYHLSAETYGYLTSPDAQLAELLTTGSPRFEAVWLGGDPVDELQATTKGYVDRAVTSLGAAYFAYNDASGVSDYKRCELIPSSGGTQSVSKASLSDGDYIQGWISEADTTPPVLLAGVYDFTMYAQKTGGTKTLQIYWELYERKSDDSEVLIATSADSDEVGGSITKFAPPIVLTDDYYPDTGSRVVGKIRARVSGSGNAPSITLYYEGDYDSRWEIPASSEVLRYLFVPYENAVSDVDLGAYGLTAQDITVTGLTQGSVPFIGSGGLLSEDNDNLYWDNTNKRLGIGTDSPATNLHIYGTGRREARVETTGATSDAILSLGTDNATRAAYLIVYGSSHASANDFAMKNAYGDIAWFTDTGGSPSERMRLSGYTLTLGTYSATDVTIWLRTQTGTQDSMIKHRELSDNYGFTVGYDGGLNQYIWRRHNNSEAGSIVMKLYRDKDLLNLTPGTDAPSSEGDLGMASDDNNFQGYIGGTNGNFVRTLYQQTSVQTEDTKSGGSFAEVAFASGSWSIPTDLWAVGKRFRVVARGISYAPCGAATGGDIIIRLKVAGVEVARMSWTVETNGTARYQGWELEGLATCRATGVSGNMQAWGKMWKPGYHTSDPTSGEQKSLVDTSGINAPDIQMKVFSGNQSVDTTAAQTIQCTVEHVSPVGGTAYSQLRDFVIQEVV